MLFVVSDVIASAKAAKESKIVFLLKDWYLCAELFCVFKTVSDMLTLSGTVFLLCKYSKHY
jgi:hypothetical protein